MLARGRQLVAARLGFASGDAVSIGCGWHPGRHLFPAPAFRLTTVDADGNCVTSAIANGTADDGFVGLAGKLELAPESSDAVLYRLVLHHIAYKEPLRPCFEEAPPPAAARRRARRDRTGSVASDRGTLAIANRIGASVAVHGTPDDVPLSPPQLLAESRAAGLDPELHAVSYAWRRLPPAIQDLLRPLERIGSRPRAAPFGHTLLLLAREP
jgi:hypothetical protein